MDTSDAAPAHPTAHLERLFPVPGEGYTWGPPAEPTWCICKWATAQWIAGEGCTDSVEIDCAATDIAPSVAPPQMPPTRLSAPSLRGSDGVRRCEAAPTS